MKKLKIAINLNGKLKTTIYMICVSCILGLLSSGSVSAVSDITYQTTINPEFTINDSLSVTLSSSDLVISDLVPGQSSDSNVITVTASSNHSYGYVLGSTVGSSTSPFDTDALVNSSNSNVTFTNMTTPGSLTAGKWGYSYATYDPTNSTWQSWSTYDGLPLYNSTADTLATTYTNGSTTVQFKIGAYADTDQPSGEYNNIINFTLTANPKPKSIDDSTYLQEVEICDTNIPLETNYTLKDSRDEQSYTVTRLKDGKCWMTENLNLSSSTALDANKTDVDNSYIANFTTSNNLTKSGNTLILPASSTSGFDTDNYSYVYNSGNKTANQSDCTNSQPCNSYYSWDAATLGSGRAISTSNANAPYSICPKNWHLPTTYYGTNDSTDLRALIIAYGGSNLIDTYDASTNPTGITIYNNLGPNTVPNLLLTGVFNNGGYYDGDSRGNYWSSTSAGANIYARRLSLFNNANDSIVYSAYSVYRHLGYQVRCIANNS